ncbi:hypothetical protein BVC80_8709g4 [Macleaya cordata]|uniref:FAS1 domain n=1 Tax=Macleaya cordata TaxID=56857 RepID=A0A200R8I3_MACCD|nr:hypothetical protein BVC80_8709g4 [Macleaya cordata]
MSQLSGKSNDLIKKVMSLHVILDYYDASKLQKLSNKTALLTTLFQSTGLANGELGFLNVTDMTSGEVSFGSAVKGSSLSANLVKSVVAQPYNISVLQISSIIIPTGIENSNSSKSPPSPPPPHAAAPAPSKSKTSPTASPSKSPAKSPPKSAKAPAPSKDASAPTADAPSNIDAADAPKLSSPPSPGQAAADAPAADDAAAPAPSKKSSSTRVTFGLFVAVFMVVVSSWFAL